MENAAVNGFQSIPYIWQSSSHNYTHGVINVRGLHLLLDIYGYYFAPVGAIAAIIWRQHSIVCFSGIFHKVLPFLRDCESTDFKPVFLLKNAPFWCYLYTFFLCLW